MQKYDGVPELAGCTAEPPDISGGRWLPGEIVAFRDDPRVPLFAPPLDFSTRGDDSRTLSAEGWALVRITDIDWTDRHGRIEILLLREVTDRQLGALLSQVRDIATLSMDLRRVHGLLTPGGPQSAPALTSAGFSREVVIPDAIRIGGRPHQREIWAYVAEEVSG